MSEDCWGSGRLGGLMSAPFLIKSAGYDSEQIYFFHDIRRWDSTARWIRSSVELSAFRKEARSWTLDLNIVHGIPSPPASD